VLNFCEKKMELIKGKKEIACEENPDEALNGKNFSTLKYVVNQNLLDINLAENEYRTMWGQLIQSKKIFIEKYSSIFSFYYMIPIESFSRDMFLLSTDTDALYL